MPVQPRISSLIARAMLDAISAALDTGTGGIVVIWSGSKPSTCEAASGGTELGTILLDTTSFAPAQDIVGTARIAVNTSTPEATATAGTGTYFRAYPTSSSQTFANRGACIIQGTVGLADSDLILDAVTYAGGEQISISSWIIELDEN